MNSSKLIKEYFASANFVSLCLMYLKEYPLNNLKKYNPGHLGSSLNINFILANLYYFLASNNLKSQIVVGTGHAGLSLTTNLWLNSTLAKYYPKYSPNKEGLNNLIADFGENIRSEINPQYPETIYDGGELGYSLAVSYGYALNNSMCDIIPCIIGDGESETGTLLSSFMLNRLLNPDSKVLPIINLNGLKMSSKSYLSLLSDNNLNNLFQSFGYTPLIVNANKDILEVIEDMQKTLHKAITISKPLIIFKSPKGYTLPNLEGELKVHKNPLDGLPKEEKEEMIKYFYHYYEKNIFDAEGNLLSLFNNFKIRTPKIENHEIILPNVNFTNENNMQKLEKYLEEYLRLNKGVCFSPDEIISNKLKKIQPLAIELLNESVLVSLYQGYIMAGNTGVYVSYEGFMPIVESIISQYYKYLSQKRFFQVNNPRPALNFILTSTCLENTYSHQNPSFVNNLLYKDDLFVNILYPKDGSSAIKCLEDTCLEPDKINVIVTSKRHFKEYPLSNKMIDIIIDNNDPEIILCATGDYMLDLVMQVYEQLKDNLKLKVIYVTNPKVLDLNSRVALNTLEFRNYFPPSVPVIYPFSGYAFVLNALLSTREIDCTVLGYSDKIALDSSVEGILKANGISIDTIIDLAFSKVKGKGLRRKK